MRPTDPTLAAPGFPDQSAILMSPLLPREPLIDPFGREIRYVRLSVTDRCNFRCQYCMPEDVEFLDRGHLMSFEEIERLAHLLAALGVQRIRLTGGEPTVRRGIVDLVARLARTPGLSDLAMTTNGWNLREIAPELRAAGLTRLNISLDTLKRDRFHEICRVDRFGDVMAGIETVAAMRWLPLKINIVVCQGLNDDEVIDFIDHFRDVPATLRFIEYMAFGTNRFPLVPWWKVRSRIEERYALEPASGPVGNGPATYWKVLGTALEVGSIGARSEQFCAGCNRIRITADGRWRNCLAYEPQMLSVRDLLRQGASDDELEAAIRGALLQKPWSHVHQEDGASPFEGHMVSIGG